ncbi:hypothetical protein, partial [Acinetobacter baumannii]|uniref:hypothetical protein n=1 Tax=Acinetobacter baumannii TaxID=470 RepID=UPI0013D3157D
MVTTSLALDHLWDRALLAGALLILFVLGGFALLRQAFRRGAGMNKVFKPLHNTVMTPLIADINGYKDEGQNGRTWRYT